MPSSVWPKLDPLSPVSGRSAGCELWICRLYGLSSRPGRLQRLLTLHSHPSILVPPSPPPPGVLFTPCRPAAVPPRRHSRPPRPWRIGQWRPFVVETRGAAAVGEWCWWRLSGGEFFLTQRTRQEREGMIRCGQVLKYRGLLLLCVARWSLRAPSKKKTLKPRWEKNSSGEKLRLHSNQIIWFNHILSQVWLAKASHTILLKFPLYPWM